MADAYTGVGAVSVDQTAYDQAVYHALRPNLYFDQVADVQPTQQSMAGAAVIFNIAADLSVQTASLNESTDVDAVAMSDSQVTLTLLEKGNAVITTAKLRGTGFVAYDKVAAEAIAWNAARSLDTIAQDILVGGSNVRYATGGGTTPSGRTSIEPEDTLAGDDTRRALADLRAADAMPFGPGYVGFIHPHVSYDFRGATGGTNWRDPHVYSDPADIYNGEMGMFENIRFIETSTAPVFADAGSSTTLTDVYATLVVGRQALAKAYSVADGNGAYPKVVPGPVTDKLRRNVPIGWYWLGVYGRFREACIRRIESSSSIGAN